MLEISTKVRDLLLRPSDNFYCGVSFDGIKWYAIKRDNISPRKWLVQLLELIDITYNEMLPVKGVYDKKDKILTIRYDKKLYSIYVRAVKLKAFIESNQTFLGDVEKAKEALVVPINVKLVEYKDPVVGKIYTIESAVEDSRNFEGRNVECVIVDYEPHDPQRMGGDRNRYRATLWVPDNREVSPTGKLGAHLAAFADFFGEEPDRLDKTLDPKNWIGTKVKIIKWEDKARAIQVVK